MIKKVWFVLLIVLAIGIWAPSAHAVLSAVGPNDVPAPPGTSFPLWYEDSKGLFLDLCLPKNLVQLNAGACLILAPFTIPIGPFPGANFPTEIFYYRAVSTIDLTTPNAKDATLVLALEATLPSGPGSQLLFGRHRITIQNPPFASDYTVTTPHGVFLINAPTAGTRVSVSSDIGSGPIDFTGALGSMIGPFLRASSTVGGAPLAPVIIPGDPSGDLFLSDPTAVPSPTNPNAPLVFVTGSPLGTDYFEICLPVGSGLVFPINNQRCVRQDLFALTGRVFNGVAFNLNQAYYLRNALGAGTVNVFGLTSSTTASVQASGTGLTPTTMLRQASTGNLFASIPFAAGTTLPAFVTATATDPPNAPTALSRNLIDLVTITGAVYNAATQTLTINAFSSDFLAPLPTLTATGLGALVNSRALVVPNVLAPPPSVTVTSTKGGSATAIVTPGLPVFPQAAKNDFDGDGKTDISVWRPSDGIWYILGSQAGFMAQQWGLPTDIPVSGDYDGDGKIDYAVWRPSEGMWYILGSQAGFMAQQWGAPTDIPVPGDYDGDGKTDIAVWRPSEGIWYILGSQAGFMAQQWGAPTDVPLP